MLPPTSKTTPTAPPSYSSQRNAHMTSVGSQTTLPTERHASWASGSHAPPPGSHGVEPGGVGLEPVSTEAQLPPSIPSLAPVTYKGSRGGHNVRAIHHPFSQAVIRDLCKAHRDYGWDSPYFRGLLRSDLEAAVVIPADLRQLFSCLMDSTEFKLWEAAWRQLLRETLPSLLVDPETAIDENGNALTLEHLMAEGRWTDPTDQASGIPVKALMVIREHAVTAFFSMVPDGPVIPYYKIIQGTKEAFTKFVERLTRAIEVQKEPFRLELTEAVHLTTTDWTFLSVNIKEQGAWPVQGKELVVIGDFFVMQKPGKDKWHLLQDLRQINNVIEDMGSLQPGMPSPTMLPQNWKLAIIDIKDCFFQIPLHPDDAPRFAFSVPTISREAPRKRYHWRVLPQGMKNSPVICQWYVASLLSPVRTAAGQAIIHHYMDDVLVCAPTDDELTHALDLTIDALIAAGFELQEEKVQRMPPWKYLGLEIGKRSIVPQKLAIKTKEVRSRRPLKALTVFTDASGKSHKSVLTWKAPQTQQWEADVAEVEGSPQVAELAAVIRAFERFPEPFNLVTDSAYVAGVVSRAEQAILQEVSNIALYELLSKLVKLVSHREQPFYVMHTRSHTDLPGFVAEGNRKADALAAPAEMAPLPNIFEQAKLSHQLFHQNAPGLVRRFHLMREQAKAIVAACPSCSRNAVPTLHAGVSPRGLRSCEVWQTDVTHFPEFGRQKYIHVSIDTFSGAVFASAHTGEKAGDVIKHLIHAFSFLGIPKELKTDNGLAYKSRELCSFLQQWGVEHKTGIPHSPTGQAMVERTHGTIKKVLHQQQRVLKAETPAVRLARALFTINFLNCSFEGLNPPIIRHFGASSLFSIRERPPVMVRDPESGRTEGPHDLVTWGCGYACVSTPTGPRWIPSKWVKPYVPKGSGSKPVISPQVADAAWRRKRKQGQHHWVEFPFPYCSYPEQLCV
ncbi:hypothetical protein DUI87_05933 [Hirundo rustica rustica]|uniref:Uncharacterized protein n=1 Tax=Hirundo rustica rustica TaxID=333673 RepID=A0A3M0KVL9_HIRRU|nr:hypothetical protein DUI87_05933 [Hirundo rustica rustica]